MPALRGQTEGRPALRRLSTPDFLRVVELVNQKVRRRVGAGELTSEVLLAAGQAEADRGTAT